MVATSSEYAAPTELENLMIPISTNMPRPAALGISIRVFRVVRGQIGTAKYANHANKISLGNGFWRDAENGHRDGRAPRRKATLEISRLRSGWDGENLCLTPASSWPSPPGRRDCDGMFLFLRLSVRQIQPREFS